MVVKTLSTGSAQSNHETASREVALLEQYIANAKKRRAGVVDPPPEDGDAIQ